MESQEEEMENQAEEMENQAEEMDNQAEEMENLPEEFLNLWKKEEQEVYRREEDGDFWTEKEKAEFRRLDKYLEELELEKKSKEQDDRGHKTLTAWKPSEMDFFMDFSVMLHLKVMNIVEGVHQKLLPLKQGRQEGVRAHNKLMAHFRHYFPDYDKFRLSWEAFKDLHFPWMAGNSYITFEDISPFKAMKYTGADEGVPRFVYEGSSDSLQIYSVKVAGMSVQQKKKRKVAGSSTQWPLKVFGVVSVRDRIDPRRNLIFYRDRDNCQIITQEDPYLELIGPTRAVGMNHDVMIEAELKVKGAVEREDKYLIADGATLSPLFGLDLVELTSHEWKLGIAVGGLKKCVEAMIFIQVINGTWPIGFRGQFAAYTKGMKEKIVLMEFNGDDVISNDVNDVYCIIEKSRHIVSVETSGELIVSYQAWKGEEGVISGKVVFKAEMSGRSFQYINVSSCSLGVLVVWSRIEPFCGEMLPMSERWDMMSAADLALKVKERELLRLAAPHRQASYRDPAAASNRAMAPTTRAEGKRKSLDADPGRSWFCQKQSSEADIPILPINVSGGHVHLSDALSIARRREESISPFKIAVGEHSIHVTPLPLEDSLSSHHILQLYNPSLQELKVDVLIEDATLYFTAFRRHVRKRTRRTHDYPLGRGPWYVFKDKVNSLPSFLKENAVQIEMDSGYGRPFPVGGKNAFMRWIFEHLAYFDPYRQLTLEFMEAMYAFMAVYCETRRSRGMMNMVTKRMKESDKPSELEPKQDKTKNMWKSFSRETIILKRDGDLGAEKELPEWCWPKDSVVLDFRYLKQLIGENGELLIAKQDAKVLRDHVTEKRFDEEAQKAKKSRPNPTMFTVPARFMPNWLLGDWTSDERTALGFRNPNPQ
ncbi:hypothetical protein HU200_045744 [Digitaria exilis]|uniref:DUF6598 domain-containing protein n=1 Tax=Digitaria exilis TaxID=1010633 RepID=A0A835AZF3_9POAL|nr:hypothetical protein HU200_045744 [Digitaria exilis]